MTTEHSEKSPAPRKKRLAWLLKINKKTWILLLVSVLVLIAGYFAFQYAKTRSELSKAQNPEAAAKEEAEDLAKVVGRYLELPQDETPTIATVNDAEKLKEQVFFAEAQNGDKVLVYTNARKAVLYRPSTKKVVEYAPVSLVSPQ